MNIKEACDIFIQDVNAGLTPDYVRLANAIATYDDKNDTSLVIRGSEYINREKGIDAFKFAGDDQSFHLPGQILMHTPLSYILRYINQDLAEKHLKALNNLIVSSKRSLFDKPIKWITFQVESDEETPNQIILLEKTINAFMPGYYEYITLNISQNPSVKSLLNWINETSDDIESSPAQRVTVTLTLKEGGSSSNIATITDTSFGEVVEVNPRNKVTQKISDKPTEEYIEKHQQLLQLGAKPIKPKTNEKVQFKEEVDVREMYDDPMSKMLVVEEGEKFALYGEKPFSNRRRRMSYKETYSGRIPVIKRPFQDKLEEITQKYQNKKTSGEIGRSGSIKQGNYDVVADLKMQVYNVFIDLENEKGRAAVKHLAEWVLSGNTEYARFSRNWKSDDTRVVILSLLSHHTDSAAWYFTNTKAYKLLEDLAKTGDTSALKTDMQMKQWKADLNNKPDKGGPSKS